MYAQRQNIVMKFLNQRCVKTKDGKSEIPLDKEVLKYTIWYNKNQQGSRPPQAKEASNQFQSSI
jgi:hypothetical protein